MGKAKGKFQRRLSTSITSIFAAKSKPEYLDSSSDSSVVRRTPSKHTRRRKKERYRKQADSSSDDDYSSLSSSDDSEAHSRPRRRKQRHQRRKKRRDSVSSSSDSSGVHERDFLTREELFELTSRSLRKRCHRLGLDTSTAVDKSDLVNTLHNYYRLSASDMVSSANRAMIMMGSGGRDHSMLMSDTSSVGRRATAYNETDQMVEVLQEIMPFFGQGDEASDSIVRTTINQLPSYALEMPDSAGNTILMLACQFGASELVPILIAKGSDVNAKNNDSVTSLHFACYTDSFSPETAQVLLKHGAQAEVVEHQYGCTPLHWAAFAGDADLCGLLCNAGARPTTLDKNGCDPIAYAKQSHSDKCAQFLLSVASAMERRDNNTGQSISRSVDTDHGDLSYWEKAVDDESGHVYFHNAATGESLWEDEYETYQRSKRPVIENRPYALAGSAKAKSPSPKKPPTPKRPPPPSPGGRTPLIRNGPGFKASGYFPQQQKEKALRSVAENKAADDTDSPYEVPASKKSAWAGAGDTKDPDESKVCRSPKQSDKVRGVGEGGKGGRTPLRVDIPPKPLDLSPITGSPLPPTTPKATNAISKDTFEERLAALQSRMEEQFVDQLKKIENKINVTPQQSAPVQDSTTSPKTKESLAEVTSKVIELQAEIGTKDLEILSLKRDIAALETKLAAGGPKEKALAVQTRDAAFGDSDLTTDLIPAEEAERLSNELDAKVKKLADVQELSMELQTKLSSAERQQSSLEIKYERAEKQISAAEESINEERAAKEEMMSLLEQTRKGIEVDAKVSLSMKEEKARDAEKISKLEIELKTLESEAEERVAAMSSKIEEQEKLLIAERMKAVGLSDEVEEIKVLYAEEKDKLAKTEQLHAAEKQELMKTHTVEIESTKDDLTRAHMLEKDALQNQLNEERLVRMEREVERNDAVETMESAMQRTSAAEAKMKEMTDMIKEAKVLIGVNERLHRALHVETDRRKTLHNKLEDLKGRIRVYVRIRPLSSSERKRQCQDVLKKEDKRTCVMARETERSSEVKSWEFDQIFCGTADEGNTQDAVFQDTRLLVTSAVDGFNVCIFAYGQTGSGKTYTMFGAGGIGGEMNTDGKMGEDCGLAPRTASEVFRVLKEKEASSHIEVAVTMFELYNDALRDLLGSKERGKEEHLRIKLAEHSDSGIVEVDGAVKEKVDNTAELLALFKRGAEYRTTASTQMNADSSRSHLITSIITTVKNKRTGRAVNGKLTLVDLAGSERVSKSGASGHQLKEAQSINKSLSALGDVISALTSGSKHVPYRNHPLTMLMSDSIGGSAKTLMFVCCSPADYNQSETANSLDFAKRCKDVTNDVSGSAGQSSQVRALRAELARMKKEKGGTMKRRAAARRPGM